MNATFPNETSGEEHNWLAHTGEKSLPHPILADLGGNDIHTSMYHPGAVREVDTLEQTPRGAKYRVWSQGLIEGAARAKHLGDRGADQLCDQTVVPAIGPRVLESIQ